MLLTEILDQVDTMVTNSLPTSMKITWINQVQNQLFRDYPMPDTVTSFTTVTGESLYPFPDNCPEDRVMKVEVDGKEIIHAALYDADDNDPFWTGVNGQLYLNPAPDGAYTVIIVYRPRPDTLSLDSLETEPIFPSDYHELLVLGCASRVAKAEGQDKLASIYQSDYEQMADKADRTLNKYRPRTVRNMRVWQ